MIELDELLNPHNTIPTWDSVVEFFKHGDFCAEHNLVTIIELYLLTDTQRKDIFDADLSVEKMLNGRTPIQYMSLKHEIYSSWNDKLGFNYFG